MESISGKRKLEEMQIEKTEVWIMTESVLQLSDGRAIRGFFGNLYENRPELIEAYYA